MCRIYNFYYHRCFILHAEKSACLSRDLVTMCRYITSIFADVSFCMLKNRLVYRVIKSQCYLKKLNISQNTISKSRPDELLRNTTRRMRNASVWDGPYICTIEWRLSAAFSMGCDTACAQIAAVRSVCGAKWSHILACLFALLVGTLHTVCWHTTERGIVISFI